MVSNPVKKHGFLKEMSKILRVGIFYHIHAAIVSPFISDFRSEHLTYLPFLVFKLRRSDRSFVCANIPESA